MFLTPVTHGSHAVLGGFQLADMETPAVGCGIDVCDFSVQAPLSRIEKGQYLNDRYEAMEERLAVRGPSIVKQQDTMRC